MQVELILYQVDGTVAQRYIVDYANWRAHAAAE